MTVKPAIAAAVTSRAVVIRDGPRRASRPTDEHDDDSTNAPITSCQKGSRSPSSASSASGVAGTRETSSMPDTLARRPAGPRPLALSHGRPSGCPTVAGMRIHSAVR